MKLPNDFTKSVRPLLEDETESFLTALTGDASISIRLNPVKTERNPMAFAEPVQRVPWSRWGFYLEERPAFTFDPLFHSGYYYVQEASSMFIEHIVRQLFTHPVTCLDLCAAPGGKSLSILSSLSEGSLLVSNEVVRQRANVLSETIAKSGYSNVMVTNNAPNEFNSFPQLFDFILVDAPCSGEGMFRKDKEAISEWSVNSVRLCAARQKDILNDVWPALKPGGVLVYSTCTYNVAENEENVLKTTGKWNAEFVQVDIDQGWGISSSFDNRVPGYRFFPHKTRGEGLFVTILKKSEEQGFKKVLTTVKNKKKTSLLLKERSYYSNFLVNPDSFCFLESGHSVHALPAEQLELLISLKERLNVVSMGIEIGEYKGKDFIPSHILAMNRKLNARVFPRYSVNYEKAIAYLRRESIVCPDAPKGFLLLTYNDEPIGFVKNLGSRANNLYPHEWRIRSAHFPDNSPEIFHPNTYIKTVHP